MGEQDDWPDFQWLGSGYSAPGAVYYAGDVWVFIKDREGHTIALEPEEMMHMCEAWLAQMEREAGSDE